MVSVRIYQANVKFRLINVYGPIALANKRNLWEAILTSLEQIKDEKIIIGGDFNATLNNSEKKGGMRSLVRSQMDFQDFVDKNML